MFHFAAGYYKVKDKVIEPDRYYVLSLVDMRKPTLLRFSCKSKFLADRYIILKTDATVHESVLGEVALDMGFKLSNRRLKDRQFPEKYAYPKTSTTWQKKKQHRTNFRQKLRKIMQSSNGVKQFTLSYRGKIYSIHHYTINKAFKALSKHTGMKWKHFIKRVSTTPQSVTEDMVFVKEINLITINQFNKQHAIHRIYHSPNIGRLWPIESSLLSIRRPKPKRLIF